MTRLNLPAYEPAIQQTGEILQIYCLLRKKWLVLTPEEWVRQHFIHLLTTQYEYPKSLLRIEGGLTLNRTAKRSDLVMYSREGTPFLVVECKAPEVQITRSVLEQALRYNHVLNAPHIVLSNGLQHFIFQKNESGQFQQKDKIPPFV